MRTERKTYLRGSFTGSFIGKRDVRIPNRHHATFYDLELLHVEIKTSPSDIRKWNDGGEFEEFVENQKFPTRIANPICLELSSASETSETSEFFKVDLHEHKLIEYELHDRLVEGNIVFGTITGTVSGYLLQVEVVEIENPEIQVNEEVNLRENPLPAVPAELSAGPSIELRDRSSNFGSLGCADIIGKGLVAIFVAYLFLVLLVFFIVVIAAIPFGVVLLFGLFSLVLLSILSSLKFKTRLLRILVAPALFILFLWLGYSVFITSLLHNRGGFVLGPILLLTAILLSLSFIAFSSRTRSFPLRLLLALLMILLLVSI